MGVFSHAYQTHRARELAEEFAVVEASDYGFGGGNLVNYFGIRSNTSAIGFLKVIQYPKHSTAIAGVKKESSTNTPAPSSSSKDVKPHTLMIYGGMGSKRQTGTNFHLEDNRITHETVDEAM